ncbi:hypothetical protein C8J57DRAFT_383832 [Mycena rebaudengoi]|nr:hypothetical protein C8J57DRAFT_383832 [Mycena rebaudengoi]
MSRSSHEIRIHLTLPVSSARRIDHPFAHQVSTYPRRCVLPTHRRTRHLYAACAAPRGCSSVPGPLPPSPPVSPPFVQTHRAYRFSANLRASSSASATIRNTLTTSRTRPLAAFPHCARCTVAAQLRLQPIRRPPKSCTYGERSRYRHARGARKATDTARDVLPPSSSKHSTHYYRRTLRDTARRNRAWGAVAAVRGGMGRAGHKTGRGGGRGRRPAVRCVGGHGRACAQRTKRLGGMSRW